MKLLIKLFKAVFLSRERYTMWHQQVEFIVNWTDIKEKDRGVLNYTIYIYPNRLGNKYALECKPKYLRFYTRDRFYYYDHQFYPVAKEKLMEFESGILIQELIKQAENS